MEPGKTPGSRLANQPSSAGHSHYRQVAKARQQLEFMPTKTKLPAITERMVTEAAIGWLRAKGWTCVRLQSGLLGTKDGRKMRVGTPGLPDWFAVKRDKYCFVELKSPGKELSAAQRDWFAQAQRNRINCVWADSLSSLIARFECGAWSVEK